jgi:hypothetical protein
MDKFLTYLMHDFPIEHLSKKKVTNYAYNANNDF